MRTIKETDIAELRRNGKIKKADGGHLKSVVSFASKKSPAPKPTDGARQIKALEEIASQLAKVFMGNKHNFEMVLSALAKVKPEVKFPAFPKTPALPAPVKKWTFTVVGRDNQGFIEKINAEAINGNRKT